MFRIKICGVTTAADASFALAFTDTWQKGYYEFLFRSEGTTTRGEHVVREVLRAKYIGPPLPDDPDGRPAGARARRLRS